MTKLKKTEVTKKLYDSILPEYRDFFFEKEESRIDSNPSEVEITDSSYLDSYKHMAEINKEEEKLYEKANINTIKAIRLLVGSLSRLNKIQCSTEKIKRKLEDAVSTFKGTLQLNNIIFHYRRNSWLESADSDQFSFIINIGKPSNMLHIQIDMDISNPKLEVSRIYTTEELYLISSDLTVYNIRTMSKMPFSNIRVLNMMAGRTLEGGLGFT